jgi:probable O-glycosylation ligase (exosortase A-associated)
MLVVATVPLALYSPFYGLLGFSWLAYMRPQDLAWGLAAGLPLSKYVAVALFAGLLLRGKVNIFRRGAVPVAMLGLWIWLLVSCLTATHRDVAFEKFQDITKVLLIAFMTTVLVSDGKRFRLSIAVIALSLGFLGLKYGLYGVLRGGVQFTRGVGGMIGDNNDFALALNMALPLLLFTGLWMRKRWVRWLAFGLIPLTALTVVFTHSRSGFLALAATTLYMMFRSRRKALAIAAVVVVAAVGRLVVPETFYERIASIGDYQNDGSAMGRLNAWQASISMANDYPIFGVGLDNFLFMFQYYAPDPDDVHVAHNTWLQVLAEAGYVGLLAYAGMFLAAWGTMFSVERLARRHSIRWAGDAARCLEASTIAFMVGGTFLNRAHFDLLYHVLILGFCAKRIVLHEIAATRDAAPERELAARAA